MQKELWTIPKWTRRWNDDWDGRHWYPDEKPKSGEKEGVIRHVFLVRHGQYNLDDKTHGLTELGKHQSRLTAQRFKQMQEGLKSDHYGSYKITWASLTSSDVCRAKETAEIIAEVLELEHNIDPLLAEGYPCLTHPGNAANQLKKVRPARLSEESHRIETAFKKYCHRLRDYKKKPKIKEEDEKIKEDFSPEKHHPIPETEEQEPEHQYEIVVCHMNVIRYFVMRSLQLPPEAWLRLRGDNCGLTEIIFYPGGRVSLGRFGDQGHLSVEETTFH